MAGMISGYIYVKDCILLMARSLYSLNTQVTNQCFQGLYYACPQAFILLMDFLLF